MRLFFLSLLALSMVLPNGALAADDLDPGSARQLDDLEQKYFGHAFHNDNPTHRADRLENLIYGETFAGNLQDRLGKMSPATGLPQTESNKNDQKSVAARPPADEIRKNKRPLPSYAPVDDIPPPPSEHYVSDKYPKVTALEFAIIGQPFPDQALADRLARLEKKAFGSSSSSADYGLRTDALEQYAQKTLHKTIFQPDDQSEAADDGSEPAKSDNYVPDKYPKVTALEFAVLGQPFPDEQLEGRLARMENKAFGSATKSQDYSQRVDSLEQYCQEKLHKKLFQPELSSDSSTEPQAAKEPDYPRVSALEKVLLGHSFAGEALSDRLSRMEKKVFGKESNSDDLSARTEELEHFCEKKLHRHPLQEEHIKEQAQTYPAAGETGSFTRNLAQVGNTLLNMAGVGLNGMGMGNGLIPMPKQYTEHKEPEPQDDPAIHAYLPPPHEAKLIIKVGWCEFHLFGQTYPKLHLPDRLDQLNRALSLRPLKSGVDLMDDVNAMLAKVQAKKQSEMSARPSAAQ